MASVMGAIESLKKLNYHRTPDEVRGNKDVIDAYLGVAHD